jgi:hypothetical protein
MSILKNMDPGFFGNESNLILQEKKIHKKDRK